MLWYSANSGTNPGQPSATSYNFTNNTITGLSSGWGLSPPIMRPGTASNLYWTSTYNVTEQASPANTGTITFEPTTQAFGFDQVVTFNSLSTNSSTVINGNNITTGIIRSDDYVVPPASGYVPANRGFSPSGMGIDLDDGSIHAEQFFVNSDGSAGFGGSINLASAGTTTRGAQTIKLQPELGSIELNHQAKVSGSVTYPAGVIRLSSQGMYANNAGLDVYSSTLGIRAKASVHIAGVSDMRENSYETPGVNFLSGLYAKAINNALDNDTPEGTKPVEAFGAVIENLRADGLVQRLHNIPAMNDEQYYDLPNKYVTYVSYLDQSGHENFLNLPNQIQKN